MFTEREQSKIMNNKKYISYCLYGWQQKYIVGAIKNIQINKKLLPDWVTIIYYSSNEYDKSFINDFTQDGVIMIDVESLEISKNVNYQMFWRYFVFNENNISIVRDLDSRITNREVEYINRWLGSSNNYFVIRDHPWQSEIPGGLFGIKSSNIFWEYFKKYVKETPLGWGVDQIMLKSFMDNINKDDISYFSYEYKKNYIKRDDKNFFIGIQLDENDEVISPNSTLALKYLEDINL